MLIIHACSNSAKDFEDTVRLLSFLRANWQEIKGDSHAPSENTEVGTPNKQDAWQSTSGFVTIQEAWADFQRHCPGFAAVDLPSSTTSTERRKGELYDEKDILRITSGHSFRNRGGWLTGLVACVIMGELTWPRFQGIDSHLSQVPSTQSLFSDARS